MMIEQFRPINGMYLTARDSPQFNDIFTQYSMATGKKAEKSQAASLTFVVTENCNLACTYCYECHKSEHRHMNFETAKKAIDQLLSGQGENYLDFKNRPCIILEFIGGEPLLEIELIDQIVEYFKFQSFALNHPWALHYMISISSNGVLYFDPKVQDFLHRNEGRVSFGISIDGDKNLHDSCRVFHDGKGSYDIVSKAAKDLLFKHPTTSTKATLSPDNIQHLFRAIKSLREDIGYHFIYCNCVFEEGWTIEHAKIFYDQLIQLADYILDNELYRGFFVSLFDETIGQPVEEDSETDNKNWCGGNGEMIAVDCDGKYFSCLRFMKLSLANQDEQSIGDIRDGFLVTPKQREWCEKLKGITMKSQSNEECNTCPIRRGCAICLGYNYDRFGDPNHRATFICVMHKARVCANAYYWNSLYSRLKIEKQFLNNTNLNFERTE